MEGPSHGYDLHQRLTTELGKVWRLSQSQAYSVLKRLEQRGEISARRKAQAKLPDRQELRITARGRKRFRVWLDGSAGRNARTVRLEFLTRLYFARGLTPKETASIYAAQAREVTGTLQRLRAVLAQTPESELFNRMSLDLRVRQMELISVWLREIRSRFGISSEAGV
jgi:DNA-binding PadR family transcriptional regulator